MALESMKNMIIKSSSKYFVMILLAFSGSGNADSQFADGQWNDVYKDDGLYYNIEDDTPDTIAINPGMNDAWYNPATSGQGFFITVFPDQGLVSLAWFTYDTVLPPVDATANLGDPGHRWLTAVGPIVDKQVTMNIEMTSGGLFDTTGEIQRTDPPGSDGTITLSFTSCNAGTVNYDITAINRQGTVNIQRVVGDNIALCEALSISTTATDCSQGALSAPIPNCAPEVPASTDDLAQDCVNRVNQLRWECQCLPPLQRWTEGEACADEHAKYDSTEGAHAGIMDDICEPEGSGFQNESADYSSTEQVISTSLQNMWDEGPGTFPASGHYLNMVNPAFSTMACGFYVTPDNKVWSVQNFQY
jgi:uncharacterized protein YkwD